MLAAGVGIAPTPSVFQTDVQTNYTTQRIVFRSSRGHEALIIAFRVSLATSAATRIELVLPRGNAPRSFAYRAKALLLSYRRTGRATSQRRATRTWNNSTCQHANGIVPAVAPIIRSTP